MGCVDLLIESASAKQYIKISFVIRQLHSTLFFFLLLCYSCYLVVLSIHSNSSNGMSIDNTCISHHESSRCGSLTKHSNHAGM